MNSEYNVDASNREDLHDEGEGIPRDLVGEEAK